MLHTLTRVTDAALQEIGEEKAVRRTQELFLLFSLGSQFDHLIKQALDKLGVFCLVADPRRVTAADVQRVAPTGIILSGGPVSVHTDPPPFDTAIFDLGIPVLGICLGFQLWAQHIGAAVEPSRTREFGTHELALTMPRSQLFYGIAGEGPIPVLESHGDRILPSDHLEILGTTVHAPVAAAHHGHLWGVQFHPEVTETTYGQQIFHNFCFAICNAKDVFPAREVAQQKISQLREQIGVRKVLLALSGGSDSATVAYLLKKALNEQPGQIRGVYIKGIDRPDDEAHVLEYFGNQPWVEVRIIDATDQFLQALAGKVTMPEKRVAMRGVYKTVLEGAAAEFGADFIAQGTLYTDISESGGGYDTGARKAQIKLHHNVDLSFTLPELAPLNDQVKDTGRNLGREIGVPEALLVRHPFPGPGLLIRIEGEITADRLRIARQLDDIYIGELRRWNLYHTVWQAGAVLTESVTTCTKGDDATTGSVVELWAFWSVNGFTAQAAELPVDFIKAVSRRMTNEIREVGSVNYNYSDKPPRTIERG